MAHAGGQKGSSEWSAKTTKRSGETCYKDLTAVMDYALRLFSNVINKPMDFDLIFCRMYGSYFVVELKIVFIADHYLALSCSFSL